LLQCLVPALETQSDKLLSHFAFTFKLRRFRVEATNTLMERQSKARLGAMQGVDPYSATRGAGEGGAGGFCPPRQRNTNCMLLFD
jgi:hypothetical protein